MAYAKKMYHPGGWETRLLPLGTGTGVMLYDPKSGKGLGIQPMYKDSTNPPDILILSSFFPPGTLPDFTEKYKRGLESEAMKDLGPAYSVIASPANMPPLEGIELMVTKR